MNRLLFLQHRSIYDGYGGIESYLHDLAKVACRAVGAKNFQCLLRGNPGKTPPDPPYPTKWIPDRSNGLAKKLGRRFSVGYLKQVLQQVDTFHPTLLVATHVSLAPMAALLSSLRQTPFAVITYGIDCWGKLLPPDRWALGRATVVFTISHWTKSVMVQNGFPEEKIHVIHPRLPDWILNSPRIDTSAEQRRAMAPEFRLLTVSRLDPDERYKGHEHVLQAIFQMQAQTQGRRLVYRIVGDGEDRRRILRIAENLNLERNVEFFPAVRSRRDLRDHYLEADIFIMPSQFSQNEGRPRGEGFGIVYIEAASLGVPVIAYNCGGATDIFPEQKGGLLVEPNNIRKLSQAITQVQSNSGFRHQLGKQGLEIAWNQFTDINVERQLRMALAHTQAKEAHSLATPELQSL